MTQEDPVEKAIINIEEAGDDDKLRMKAFQEHLDKMRLAFDDAVRTAEPDPDTLKGIILANATTKPKVGPMQLALMWMQRSPESWQGYHPDRCQDVARWNGIGQEA